MKTPSLYPDCGCPPVREPVVNLVCRNADCLDYGTHRRGLVGDCCQWCGDGFRALSEDPLRGAR